MKRSIMSQSGFSSVRMLHARDDVVAADAAPCVGPRPLIGASGDMVTTAIGQVEPGIQPASILTHAWIWSAIDLLAERHALSPSALARRAGLDPTTFNPSKRITAGGNPRWPSTASLAKVLEATSTTLDEFASLHAMRPMQTKSVGFADSTDDPRAAPILAEIRNAQVPNWPPQAERRQDSQSALRIRSPFGLTVADDSLEPVYSRGNTLIVSIGAATRPGDKVVLEQRDEQPSARLFLGENSDEVVVGSLVCDGHVAHLERASIDWMGRIVWVRQ
jgi:phage repressor protein C with HTH and peptisase S24 domain